MSKPTITEFLEARISEDEIIYPAGEFAHASHAYDVFGTYNPHCPECIGIGDLRMKAECAAKRAIIKQHEEWPVLVEREPSQLESVAEGLDSITYRMTREIAWLTTKEYIKRFGVEPPTAPMILTLAAVYKDHPDYQPEWAHGA